MCTVESKERKHINPYVLRVGGLVLKKDFTGKQRKGGKWIPNE